jgi:hypothetical protein
LTKKEGSADNPFARRKAGFAFKKKALTQQLSCDILQSLDAMKHQPTGAGKLLGERRCTPSSSR